MQTALSDTLSQYSPKLPRCGKRTALRQVLALQNFTFESAEGLTKDFRGMTDKESRARVACAISQLAKGWVTLQDAKREIQGKPRLGVVPASKQKLKKGTKLGEAEILDDVTSVPFPTESGDQKTGT